MCVVRVRICKRLGAQESIPPGFQGWDGNIKLLRSPGIDSKELIPPAYVAWRAGKTSLFQLCS
jgi:hypothetical protein